MAQFKITKIATGQIKSLVHPSRKIHLMLIKILQYVPEYSLYIGEMTIMISSVDQQKFINAKSIIQRKSNFKV